MTEALMIDAEHPWPWLEAFPEYAAAFFNGRDDDAEALLRCLLAAPATVLFGKSGLGKSSLLQAGLFPALRKERLLPVYVRLQHEKDSTSVSEQIAKRFMEEIQTTQKPDNTYTQLGYRSRTKENSAIELDFLSNDSLWAALHRTDVELQGDDGRRWYPVFVLDQFEEIFTLGAMDSERQKQLFYDLGDLIENRLPKALAERLHVDDELFDRLNLDVQHYRLLVSLREDYLPDLEEWSDLIPRLGLNRYRLSPMSVPQAIAAVEKTGGALVTHEDSENIVRYLSETQAAHEHGTHRRRALAKVEPALLSLMCSGLNVERLKKNKERLATGNLAQEGGFIVERFYDAVFTGLPKTVRDFVEQYLITADGVRLQYPVRSVETVKLATEEQIKTLVDRRLIRRESLEQGDHIELVHDRLAQVALQGRQESQRRKEDLRQEEERRRLEIALRYATSLKLVAQAKSMLARNREGGDVRAYLQLVTAARLSRDTEVDAAILEALVTGVDMHWIAETLSPIYAVAFSPNGSRIVSGNGDNTLRLWDANTGQPIGQPLQGHEDVVKSVAFSSDSSRIVSGSYDNTLQLWDTLTGQSIGEPLKGHEGQVYSVAFSPDDSRIVSGSEDKTLRLWDANTGQPIGQPLQGHEGQVYSVAFNLDGTRIVSGSDDKTLRLWDANTGQPLGNPLTGHNGSVYSVVFSPEGNRIVSGSGDKTLRLWDARTRQPLCQPFQGHDDLVFSVAFSPDGTRIVSSSGDSTLRLWDANTGQPLGQSLKGHSKWVNSVAFSPDSTRIVSGNGDNTLRLWDANADQNLCQILNGHENWVSSVAFSPDGSHIVSGSGDSTLRLWDVNTGQLSCQPLKGHEDWVYCVAFSPNGARIVSGSEDDNLRLWDTHTGQPLGQPLTGHKSPIYSVAFSPDGARIVSGSWDKTLRLWDANTCQAIGQPLKGHENRVASVAFSPDGSRLVSGSWDKTLRLWNANTGQPIGQPLKGHEYGVNSVAFSPNGSRIVSGSGDNTLRLWDVNTGQTLGQPLYGHDSRVHSVAFSPDGRCIVSGSGDNTLRLWNANTGQPIGQPLQGHKSDVTSVAFSSDGSHIVSGSRDNTLRLWPAPKIWHDQLCKKLTRNMSHKEWREWVSPDIDYVEQCPGLPIPPDEPESISVTEK